MTSTQIAYFQQREAERHNRAQEDLSRYATDTNKEIANIQADTSRFVATTGAQASMYAADRHYDASVYAADVNAATQKYVSDQNARVQEMNKWLDYSASVYATDVNASTQRYSADRSYAASTYATDVNARVNTSRTEYEHADRQAQVEFQRQSLAWEQKLDTAKLELEQLRTAADTSLTRANVKRVATEVRTMLGNLSIASQRLHLDEEAQMYTNMLNTARTIESATQSTKNIAGTIDTLFKVITAALAL